MKKTFYSWASMLILVLVGGLSLTSCDSDEMKAMNLDGTWEGKMGMYFENTSGYWDADYSVIEFHQKPFTNHGYGYQIDYYSGYKCPIRSYFSEFDWSVTDGVVTLVFPDNPDLNTQIYDYRMTSSYFTGFIGPKKYCFKLEKVSDWNWGEYQDRVSSDHYYYSRERKEIDTTSEPKTDYSQCIHRGPIKLEE